MSCAKKVSDLFATHCLSLVAGTEQKCKQCLSMECKLQFVKVFIGPNGWGITVFSLYAVHTCLGSCMTCCNVCVSNSELLLHDLGM